MFLSTGVHTRIKQSSGGLAAVGCARGSLLQQLEATAAAGQQAQLAVKGPGDSSQAVIVDVEQLHALGGASCTLAVPLFCNNPGCSNHDVRGAAEHLLKNSSCTGRRTARYCSTVCQHKHMQQHKLAHKAVAAAQS
jgi:hypothetical protein